MKACKSAKVLLRNDGGTLEATQPHPDARDCSDNPENVQRELVDASRPLPARKPWKSGRLRQGHTRDSIHPSEPHVAEHSRAEAHHNRHHGWKDLS